MTMVNRLPQIQQFDPMLTAQDLIAVVATIPVGKARGLDNWSNGELRMLSSTEFQMLADILNRIVVESTWPESMLDAAVTLLAKVQCPQTPKQSRPITVLSTLYRLWAKAMSKKMFASMIDALPEHLYGSVPNRCSTDAAWLIQDFMDEAIANETPATAVSLDLSKAYNTIQRDILGVIAKRLGWPEMLLTAYQDFLNRLRRRFKLHAGLHGCSTSTVGVPEGDPIAVISMILITWVVTLHIQHGDGTLASYVDNWTLMTDTHPTDMQTLLSRMKAATDTLCLLLNPDKTTCFSTSSEYRAIMRSMEFHGFPLHVANQLQDLGVGYNVTKQATAKVLLQRFQANDHKLHRLQLMPWSAARKCQVILRIIAPAMFFGVPFASTSPTFLAMLRGRFSATIWGGRTRNHFLAPMFGTDVVYEPALLTWAMRLQALRRMFSKDADRLTNRWSLAVQKRATGPLLYIFQHLQMFGAEAILNLKVKLDDGKIWDLVRDDTPSLQYAMQLSWCRMFSAKLERKEEFRDIRLVDWDLTSRFKKASQVPQTTIGNFMSGAALFTRQKLHFLDDTSARCMHCGEEDSQHHRLFHCPFYASCRIGLPIQSMEHWPALFTQWGFVKCPCAIKEWDHYVQLLQIPDEPPFFCEHVHLFTDGSTACADTVARSAWSVQLADPQTLEPAMFLAGEVPGLQDNYRAELCAAMVAIQSSRGAHLHVDNIAVVHGIQRLLSRGWEPAYWSKHRQASLWYSLWVSLEAKLQYDWQISHVKSHRSRASASRTEEWEIAHNEHADYFAKQANIQRQPEVLQMHYRAHQEFLRLRSRIRAAQTLQSRIVMTTSTASRSQAVSPTSVPILLWHQPVPFQVPVDDFSDAILCPPFLDMLATFLRNRNWFDTGQPCPIHLLYIHFVQQTGWVVPLNLAPWKQETVPVQWRCRLSAAWIHETSYPNLVLMRQIFSKQSTTFLHALKLIVKRYDLPFTFDTSPALLAFQHTPAVGTISLWPETLQTSGYEPLLNAAGSAALRTFFHKRFCPTLQPMTPRIQQESPSFLMNNYYNQRRLRLRR